MDMLEHMDQALQATGISKMALKSHASKKKRKSDSDEMAMMDDEALTTTTDQLPSGDHPAGMNDEFSLMGGADAPKGKKAKAKKETEEELPPPSSENLEVKEEE